MAEAVASVCQELSQNGMIYTLAWTNGKELCTEEIPGTDELLQIIPQMYKSGTDLEKSGVDWWLETEKSRIWKGIVFLQNPSRDDRRIYRWTGLCTDM